jgi:hypothetical protein
MSELSPHFIYGTFSHLVITRSRSTDPSLSLCSPPRFVVASYLRFPSMPRPTRSARGLIYTRAWLVDLHLYRPQVVYYDISLWGGEPFVILSRVI